MSPATKTARARPRSPVAPTPLERPQPRLSARAAVLFALVIAILLASVVPMRQYLEQRTTIAELERRATQLEASNRELAEEIERLRDPEVLERLARECLGMVDPGEIRFVPVPEGGAPVPPEC